MRIGTNPAKSVKKAPQPQTVTVAVLSYIPFLSGYYRQSLDVLKLCLASILKNTDLSYDLLVFDNGSCTEVVEYLIRLRTEGYIQHLILSDKNIGKVGAWNFIFGAAPGEYIAYTDGDVFFYPSWPAEHIRLFDTFPNVGMVTGVPIRRRPRYFTKTIELAETSPEIQMERGSFIPQEWIDDHGESLGRKLSEYTDLSSQFEDFRLSCRGVRAYAGAAHFQFVTRAEIIRQYLPFQFSRPMGLDVSVLDKAVNEAGYLKLSTERRYVQHIGNALSPKWMSKASKYGVRTIMQPASSPTPRLLASVVDWHPVREMLLSVYDRIFRLYYNRAE